MTRALQTLVAFALVGLLIAGCSSSAASPTPSSGPPQGGATPAGSTGAATSPPSEKLSGTLTIYSGRNEKLIAPLIERFKRDAPGVEVKIRYGDSAELAATILEEGNNSPADVFFSQDAGALGALAQANRLAKLPETVSYRVEERFRSPKNEWLGVSGRARVLVYNTQALKESDLPESILGLTDPKWQGKIGWAPTNASLQAQITALRLTEGEAGARRWLEGIKANDARVYKDNTAVVKAVGAGEVQVGLVNHYYLYNVRKESPNIPAANSFPRAGGAGSLVNVAGVGVLSGSKNAAAASRFVEYLLTKDAQQYFADETFEYPLVEGVATQKDLVPLKDIKTPQLDLSSLADLRTTLNLMREVGVL